jgi:hypothetical protein
MNKDPRHLATITLDFDSDETFDGLPGHTIQFTINFADMTAHGWFALFEKIMGVQGFSELNIMRGATNLAFREGRLPEDMRKVAKEYDLKLVEDLDKSDDDTEAPI